MWGARVRLGLNKHYFRSVMPLVCTMARAGISHVENYLGREISTVPEHE